MATLAESLKESLIPSNYIQHLFRCGKYAPMVTHRVNQCVKVADPTNLENKYLVWVYYVDGTRPPLTWEFPLENMEEAIDIARLYSQDENVLNTVCGINQIYVARFAGFFEGRKYE